MAFLNHRKYPADATINSHTRHAPLALPPISGWRLAVAGGLAGMLTNTMLHPLDTIKTLRQAHPTTYRHGILPTMRAIIRSRGALALYAGIGPALVGSALSSALYFGAYERVRRLLYDASRLSDSVDASPSKSAFKVSGTRIRVPVTAFAAACGNIASSILFVPKEVVKQRMQAASELSPTFLGVATNLIRTSGPLGLYRGYQATLLRNIPSTMVRFAVYEELKLALRSTRAFSRDVEVIVAGAIAGVVASTVTTPMDVVKTRLATGSLHGPTSIPQAFASIVRQNGVQGLFAGLRPRLVWSALFAAIGFSSYELCKELVARWHFPKQKRLTTRVSPLQLHGVSHLPSQPNVAIAPPPPQLTFSSMTTTRRRRLCDVRRS